MAFPERGRRRIAIAIALLAIILASPDALVLAQTSTSSGPFATVGNSFTWSISKSYTSPGPVTSTSTSTLGTVTETVENVSDGIVTLRENTSSGYSSTVSGSIDSPLPPNSGGTYFYIPPAQLQTTLNEDVSAIVNSLILPASGFTMTPTVSQKTIGTSLGDVSTWTLDLSGSGISTAAGETFQGSEKASLSYDSQLGLIVSMHEEEGGMASGSNFNESVLFTLVLKIIGSSVPLTAGAGGSSLSILVGVVATLVVVLTVLVLFASRSKNKAMSPSTEPGVLAPQQPPENPGRHKLPTKQSSGVSARSNEESVSPNTHYYCW